MGNGIVLSSTPRADAGGAGWVQLVYVPRSGRLINQYASVHTRGIADGIPILALDMYEHACHIDVGANARAYINAFIKNIDWKAIGGAIKPIAEESPEVEASARRRIRQ